MVTSVGLTWCYQLSWSEHYIVAVGVSSSSLLQHPCNNGSNFVTLPICLPLLKRDFGELHETKILPLGQQRRWSVRSGLKIRRQWFDSTLPHKWLIMYKKVNSKLLTVNIPSLKQVVRIPQRHYLGFIQWQDTSF